MVEKVKFGKGPASKYELSDERIFEFSDGRGNGGLLSLRKDATGIVVEVYNPYGTVVTRVPAEPAPSGFNVYQFFDEDGTRTAVLLRDGDEELVMWDQAEWVEDPTVVFAITNAIRLGYEEGPDAVRAVLAGG